MWVSSWLVSIYSYLSYPKLIYAITIHLLYWWWFLLGKSMARIVYSYTVNKPVKIWSLHHLQLQWRLLLDVFVVNRATTTSLFVLTPQSLPWWQTNTTFASIREEELPPIRERIVISPITDKYCICNLKKATDKYCICNLQQADASKRGTLNYGSIHR